MAQLRGLWWYVCETNGTLAICSDGTTLRGWYVCETMAHSLNVGMAQKIEISHYCSVALLQGLVEDKVKLLYNPQAKFQLRRPWQAIETPIFKKSEVVIITINMLPTCRDCINTVSSLFSLHEATSLNK